MRTKISWKADPQDVKEEVMAGMRTFKGAKFPKMMSNGKKVRTEMDPFHEFHTKIKGGAEQ